MRAVNRIQLQQLSEERARDAEMLLGSSQWSGAYYLAGYAVECGLKACIAKFTNLHDYPDKDFAARCYSHNIESLVDVAGLKDQRKVDVSANIALRINWTIVRDWDVKARYRQWTELQARRLFAAISDPANGVLSWIMVRW